MNTRIIITCFVLMPVANHGWRLWCKLKIRTYFSIQVIMNLFTWIETSDDWSSSSLSWSSILTVLVSTSLSLSLLRSSVKYTIKSTTVKLVWMTSLNRARNNSYHWDFPLLEISFRANVTALGFLPRFHIWPLVAYSEIGKHWNMNT